MEWSTYVCAMKTVLRPTLHAIQRMKERKIQAWMVNQTIMYGNFIQFDGNIYHYITRKCMPPCLSEAEKSALDNTVVVESEACTIITVWKDTKALKNLMKKRKNLSRAA